MMKKLSIYVILSVVFFNGCNSDTISFTEKTRSPKNVSVRYFSTFSGYELPFRPIHEIDKETARGDARKTYLLATYDDSGKLVTCTKYFRTDLDWEVLFNVNYFYDLNDVLARTMWVEPDAGEIERFYNENATLIKIKYYDIEGNLRSKMTRNGRRWKTEEY